jgi:hypothetical protein
MKHAYYGGVITSSVEQAEATGCYLHKLHRVEYIETWWISETYILDHYLSPYWTVATRVNYGQKVLGKPSTQILQGNYGSINIKCIR